jgi:hypothetical protein
VIRVDDGAPRQDAEPTASDDRGPGGVAADIAADTATGSRDAEGAEAYTPDIAAPASEQPAQNAPPPSTSPASDAAVEEADGARSSLRNEHGDGSLQPPAAALSGEESTPDRGSDQSAALNVRLPEAPPAAPSTELEVGADEVRLVEGAGTEEAARYRSSVEGEVRGVEFAGIDVPADLDDENVQEDVGTQPSAREEATQPPRIHRIRPPARPRVRGRDRRQPEPSSGFRLSDAYARWNRLLADRCLLGSSGATRVAYLSVTPRILAAALEAEEGELLSPEDATQDLVSAVSLAYQASALTEPEKLWALAAPGTDELPQSIAFLALTVLAAYQMHSDEDAGPNAYYPRLASLLGCDLVGGHPQGFEPADFGDLWDALSAWLERQSNQALALPGPEPGLRRFIAYPLGHVPLRQVDIEKLPDFFDWAGLEPASKADPAFLGDAFRRWAAARGLVSRAGEQSIEDERRPAVESQLALELEAWDGSWTDRSGQRTAAVHVLLDYRRRQPHLFFLPRRPLSFPPMFDDGSHVFQSGEQGWYDPVPIATEDGAALADGFQWTCSSPQGQVTLHRPPTAALALRPASDFTGYLSQRGIPLGIESAVLCVKPMEAAAEEYLTAVTSVRCRALDHPAVPDGWRLFSGIIPKRVEPPPSGLDALAVESSATVILRGGLRVGRRAAWLLGAPPSILLGGPEGLTATIDGRPAPVRQGLLDASGRLGVGQHIVAVGRVRRRLEILEPEGRWDECTPLVGITNGAIQTSVALPPGGWTVIGARPDQVARAACSDRGTLVAATFDPVWAVSVGGGPGATVLCLTDPPPTPQPVGFGRGRPHPPATARAWVATIYSAQIRRPRLGWACEKVGPDVQVRAAWRSYWLTARGLKRQWRGLA